MKPSRSTIASSPSARETDPHCGPSRSTKGVPSLTPLGYVAYGYESACSRRPGTSPGLPLNEGGSPPNSGGGGGPAGGGGGGPPRRPNWGPGPTTQPTLKTSPRVPATDAYSGASRSS